MTSLIPLLIFPFTILLLYDIVNHIPIAIQSQLLILWVAMALENVGSHFKASCEDGC